VLDGVGPSSEIRFTVLWPEGRQSHGDGAEVKRWRLGHHEISPDEISRDEISRLKFHRLTVHFQYLPMVCPGPVKAVAES
jgi:hypothetical protein